MEYVALSYLIIILIITLDWATSHEGRPYKWKYHSILFAPLILPLMLFTLIFNVIFWMAPTEPYNENWG